MIEHSGGLTSEESDLFIEVFEASLRINQREQFFSWLQGSFQSLLPHEVLICGIHVDRAHGQQMQFERFISTRYLTDQHFIQATHSVDGLVSKAIKHWQQTHRPLFVGEGLMPGDFGTHTVPFVESPAALNKIELKNLAAHGMAGRDGDAVSFFSFSRIPAQLSAKHAYLLELLIPHLHAVLMRILNLQPRQAGLSVQGKPSSDRLHITEREQDVIKWIRAGKTNQEIAAILNISQLTVKNHVHSAIRKLGVENRSQAADKAYKLGMIQAG